MTKKKDGTTEYSWSELAYRIERVDVSLHNFAVVYEAVIKRLEQLITELNEG